MYEVRIPGCLSEFVPLERAQNHQTYNIEIKGRICLYASLSPIKNGSFFFLSSVNSIHISCRACRPMVAASYCLHTADASSMEMYSQWSAVAHIFILLTIVTIGLRHYSGAAAKHEITH